MGVLLLTKLPRLGPEPLSFWFIWMVVLLIELQLTAAVRPSGKLPG